MFAGVYDGPDDSAPLMAELSGNVDTDGFDPTTTSTGSSMYISFTSDDAEEDEGFNAMIFCPDDHAAVLSSYCPLSCGACSSGCEAELDAGLERNTAVEMLYADEMSTGTGSAEFESLVSCLMTPTAAGYIEGLAYGEWSGYLLRGYVSASGAMCIACGPGTEPSADGVSCLACPLGQYSLGNQCLPCPPGTKPSNGNSYCELCPSSGGKYSPYGKTCLICPAGTEPKYMDVEDKVGSSNPEHMQYTNTESSQFTYMGAQECEACSLRTHVGELGAWTEILTLLQVDCQSEFDVCIQQAADPGCVDDASAVVFGLTGKSCALSLRQWAEEQQSSLSAVCGLDLSASTANSMFSADPPEPCSSCVDDTAFPIRDNLSDGHFFGHFDGYSQQSGDTSDPMGRRLAEWDTDDGAGSGGVAQYADNSDCGWVATCSQGPVTVMFKGLSTEQDSDFLRMYDGPDDSAPLMAELSGVHIDLMDGTTDLTDLSSTGSSMYISFTSDGAVNDMGFEAMIFCPGEHAALVSSLCPVSCGMHGVPVCSPGCEAELDAGLERNTALEVMHAEDMSTGTGSAEFESLVSCLITSGAYGLAFGAESGMNRIGYASAAGLECLECAEGTEASPDGVSCVQCGESQYSMGGGCKPCPPGTAPANGRSTCAVCVATNGFSPYGKSCLTCPGGTQPKYIDSSQSNLDNSMFAFMGALECEACATAAQQYNDAGLQYMLQQVQSTCQSEYDACELAAADADCADDNLGWLAEVNGVCSDILAVAACTYSVEAWLDTLVPNDAFDSSTLHSMDPASYPLVQELCPLSCGQCSIGCLGELEEAVHLLTGIQADSIQQIHSDGTAEYQAVAACLQSSILYVWDIQMYSIGMTSATGSQCIQCQSGKAPNTGTVACVDCSPGRYSNGDLCRRCPAGTRPSSAKTYCESCQLAGTNKYSSTGAACDSCAAGTQPNLDLTGCDSCSAMQTLENDAVEAEAHQMIRASCQTEYDECAATTPANDCAEDAEGYLSSVGLDCDYAIEMTGWDCSVDMNVYATYLYGNSGKQIPVDTFLWRVCPIACGYADAGPAGVSGEPEYVGGILYIPAVDDSPDCYDNLHLHGAYTCSDIQTGGEFEGQCNNLVTLDCTGPYDLPDFLGFNCSELVQANTCYDFASAALEGVGITWPAGVTLRRLCPVECTVCEPVCLVQLETGLDLSTALTGAGVDAWPTVGVPEYESLLSCLSRLAYSGTLYRTGRSSSAGNDCTYCDEGKEPNFESSICADCPAGKYSVGDKCRWCPLGKKPSSSKGYCESCQLQGLSSYGPDGARCLLCPAGAQPNAERTGCESCQELSVATKSYAAEQALHTISVSCPGEYSGCAAVVNCSTEMNSTVLADNLPDAGSPELLALLDCIAWMGIEVYIDRVGLYSLAGAACIECTSGKQPEPNTQGSCVDCAAGEYSGGDHCRSCAPGTQPSTDKGRCDPCTTEGDSSHSIDGIACSACPAGSNPSPDRAVCLQCSDVGAGFYSATGSPCQMCGSGKQPAHNFASCEDCGPSENSDGSVCTSCAAGTQPSTDKGRCDLCAIQGLSSHSTDGIACSACPAGSNPSPDRTACVLCSDVGAGFYSATGSPCQMCGSGKQPAHNFASCEDCGPGEFSDGSTCTSCAAGTQPSTDKGRCDPCTTEGDSSHSTDGITCSACPAGSNPNANRTVCLQCSDVGAGFYSATGSPCQMCGVGKQPHTNLASCVDCGPGENSDGSVCTSCAAGSQPSGDKGSCNPCQLSGASAYSADGVTCVNCVAGLEPNADRTGCLACVDLASAVNDGVTDSLLAMLESSCSNELTNCTAVDHNCTLELRSALSAVVLPSTGADVLLSVVACVEASGIDLYTSRKGMYSLAGAQCTDCGVGKQPASGYGSCADCVAGEYSGGDRCRRCPPGTKPSNDKSRCVPCSLDGASAYSSDGASCLSCPGGSEPLPDRTGCVLCADKAYMNPLSAESTAGGPYTSATGASCTACGVGKQPNLQRVQCDDCGAGEFSVGDHCALCPAGAQPAADKGSCDSCKLDGDNAYSTNGVACVTCPAGSQPSVNQTACVLCADLAWVNASGVATTGGPYYSATGAQCSMCADGMQPNAARTACDSCNTIVGGDPYFYSADGVSCIRCEAGYEVNARRTACERCIEQYSSDGRQCLTCAAGSQPETAQGAGTCRSCGELTAERNSNIDAGVTVGRVGLYSLAGVVCVECASGKQPEPNTQGSCVDCAAGEYSGGDHCRSCAPGTQPSTDKGRCDPCTTEGDSSHSIDGIACSACPAGSNPNANRTVCLQCSDVGDAAFSLNGGPCQACAAGNRPDPQRSSCEACVGVGDSFFVSLAGAECVRCSAGSQPNALRTGCDTCVGQFSADGTQCANCLDGFQTHQQMGAASCLSCANLTRQHNTQAGAPGSARVGKVSMNGGDCIDCGVGKMPNADNTVCISCSVGEFSGGDECQSCAPGAAPSNDQSRCDSCLVQGLNAYSPDGADCQTCDSGQEPLANLTACQTCTIRGQQFVSSNGEPCVACVAGKEVDGELRMCNPCQAGTFSAEGAVCMQCEPGKQPNTGRSGCEFCPPSEYFDPVIEQCARCDAGFQLNENCADPSTCDNCVACPSGTTGTTGVCVACSEGLEPNVQRTACAGCNAGTYSSAGHQCIECGLSVDEVGMVSMDKKTCVQCLPGKSPSQTRDACNPCAVGMAGQGGVCEQCSDGHEPDANSFGCQSCPLGKAGTDGVCFDCLPGAQPSSDLISCRSCACVRYMSVDQSSSEECAALGDAFVGCVAAAGGHVSCVPAGHGGPLQSPLGRECVACKAGKMPGVGLKECVDCSEGEVSLGDMCTPCPAGSEPSNDLRVCDTCVGRNKKHSTDGVLCQDCLPGQEPLADATGCANCTSKLYTTVAVDGTVKAALGGPFHSTGGASCDACSAGYQPTAARDGCELCGAINLSDPYYYSEDGVQCLRCGPGYAVNPAKTGCNVCVGQFSADGKQCSICPNGYQPATASGAAGCVACSALSWEHNAQVDAGNLSSARVGKTSMNGAVCNDCGAGKMPNADNTECVSCVDGEYSVGDRCRKCAPGTETSGDKSRCDSCLIQGLNSFSTDGVSCEDCWSNSEPLGPLDRSNCRCKPGFVENGTEVCIDIDECAVGYVTGYSNGGTCTGNATDLCYTYSAEANPVDSECGCCHRYSAACMNSEGSFQCLTCLDGFVGSGYGPQGCSLPEPVDTSLTIGCDGVPFTDGGLRLDMCGLCGGTNSTCSDCLGVPLGDARVDRCGVCSRAGAGCMRDCLGVWGGQARTDICDLCNGNNSTCLDCAGVPDGESKLDRCGACSLPWEACTRDCSGIWGGTGIRDGCGVCGGDNNSCADCNGVPFGRAVIDRCAACVLPMGACRRDCAGVWGGHISRDACSVCGGDNSTCVGCDGIPNSAKVIDTCGACVPKHAACTKDCAGDWGGGKTVDVCGVCGGDGICREAVRIAIDIPGSVDSFDKAAKDSIRGTVSTAIALDLQFISIVGIQSSGATTIEIQFELLVEKSSSDGRRRLQWGDLASGLASGVASATGVDLSEVMAGTPVSIVIDCHGNVGGDALVDVCGECSGDNSSCTDCAGDSDPMYCSTNGTAAGQTNSTPSRMGLSNAWHCDDVSTVVFSSPGPALQDACSMCDNNELNNCLPNCQGQTGLGVGVVPDTDDPLLDTCGVCGGNGNSCGDCAGTPNGNATLDRCGTCDTTALNDCAQDCAGVWGGSALVDACEVCDQNATNDGSSCSDCAGVPNGAAYTDICGNCDANTTNDCMRDCAGVWGGPTLLDECSVCAGDDTTCADCFGEPNGPGETDRCDECTNHTDFQCVRDCDGVWGGMNTLDLCGVCDNSTENDDTSCQVDATDTAVPDAVLLLQVHGDADLDALVAAMASAMAVPIEAIEATAIGDVSTVVNRTADVQLGIAIEDVSNATSRAAFISTFAQDVSVLLGIDIGRVDVTAIVGGSVVVTFTVGPSADGGAVEAHALSSALSPNVLLAGSAIAHLSVHPQPPIEVAFAVRSTVLLEAEMVVSDVLVSLEAAVSVGTLAGLEPGQSVFASLSMICPSGYYGSSDGGCVRCPLGSEPNAAQDGCELCQRLAVGDKQTWVSTNGGICVLCEAGKAPNDARTACMACEAGTFNSGSGKACARCADATMVPSDDSDACVCPSKTAQFPDGTFDSTTVLLSCFESDFSELDLPVTESGRACMSCTDLPGPGLGCVECSKGKPFALDGWGLSKSGKDAYNDALTSNGSAANGSTLQILSSNATAAAPAGSRNLFKCPYKNSCIGEDVTNSSALMKCSEGYTGVLCALCEKDWHRSPDGCIQCTEQASGNSAIATMVAAVAVPTVLLWRLVVKPRLEKMTAGLPEDSGLQRVGLETKFKIAVSLFQVVASFPFTLSLTYPAQFTELLNYIKIIFLDIVELVRVDCLMETSLYVNTGLAAALLPGLILLLYIPPTLCLVTKSGRQARRDGTAYKSALNRSFFVIFMLYPYLSKTSFRAFACRDLDEGESYHMDHYEVDCNSPDYIMFRYCALGMLVAFPVGLPLLFFCLLHANRERLKHEKKEGTGFELLLGANKTLSDEGHPEQAAAAALQKEADEAAAGGLPPMVVKMLQKRAQAARVTGRKKKKWWEGGSDVYSFLTRDYKPSFYYFECIELVRKMLLAGAIIFMSQGSIEQAFVAGVISFFFFAVYARCMPFRDRFDNFLKLCAEVQTFMTLFISIILRTASSQGGKLEHEDMYGNLLVGTNIIVTPVPMLFGILIPMGCNSCIYTMLCCRRSKRHLDTEQVTPGKDKYTLEDESGEGGANAEVETNVKTALAFMTPDDGLEVEDLEDEQAAGKQPEMTIDQAKQLMAEQAREKAELQRKLSDSERKATRLEKILEREKKKTQMGAGRGGGRSSLAAAQAQDQAAAANRPTKELRSESLVFDGDELESGRRARRTAGTRIGMNASSAQGDDDGGSADGAVLRHGQQVGL